jgi:hypothetical protein
MPSIITQCPDCRFRCKVDHQVIGRRAKCPKCGQTFAVQPVAAATVMPEAGVVRAASAASKPLAAKVNPPVAGLPVAGLPVAWPPVTGPPVENLAEHDGQSSAVAAHQTHCPRCQGPLRVVVHNGKPSGGTLCLSCNPTSARCAFCRGSLRSSSAQQCLICKRSWHRTVLESLDASVESNIVESNATATQGPAAAVDGSSGRRKKGASKSLVRGAYWLIEGAIGTALGPFGFLLAGPIAAAVMVMLSIFALIIGLPIVIIASLFGSGSYGSKFKRNLGRLF